MAKEARFDPDSAQDCKQGKLPRGSLCLALLVILLGTALFGYLGGAKSPRMLATAPQADLMVKTPTRLRSGLYFEQIIRVQAHQTIDDVVIGIGAPLWQDMTVNSMIPAAADEQFKAGQYRLHYGPLQAGEVLSLKIDGQINPALTRGTHGPVALFDGDRQIVSVPLKIEVLP